MTDLNTLTTPQPYYIPGYSGHCPKYIFRSGDTYGSTTHKILCDPQTRKSGVLVLSDRAETDYKVISPSGGDEFLSRNYYYNSIFKQPIVPGYTGRVPGSGGLAGQRVTVDAFQGLLEFERQKLRRKNERNDLIREIEAANGQTVPTLEERMKSPTVYKLPLLEARPEYSDVIQSIAVPEPAPGPDEQATSLLKQGGNKTGKQVPFGHARYVEADFTTNYRLKESSEWAPVSVVRSEPPLVISSAEIYHKHIGLVPNYTGHIPGYNFRSGRTFGSDTRDAKRWLRGDHSG